MTPRVLVGAAMLCLLVAGCTPARTELSVGRHSVASAVSQDTIPFASTASSAGVTSKQSAISELHVTVRLYVLAEQAYGRGDNAGALLLMDNAYAQHFEPVADWIDEAISSNYRETLDAAISRDLRTKLRDSSGSSAEIAAQFPVALQRLRQAADKLGSLP